MSVLITGSSGGLGLDLGKLFLKNNFDVIFHSRTNIDIIAKNNIQGSGAHQIYCELSEYEQVKTKIYDLFETDCQPNLIICNAGASSFEENSQEDIASWRQSFDSNFYSALNVINACLEVKKNLKFVFNTPFHIICISSICGIERVSGAPIQYSIAKSALNNMVKFYAKDLAREGIFLNAIAPGNIMFPGSLWERKLQTPEKKKSFLNSIPSRKFIETSEIYEMINFISSSHSSNIIGQVMILDGGQTNSF